MNMNKSTERQDNEFLAMELLGHLGNKTPKPHEIKYATFLLSTIVVHKKLNFKSELTEREISCLLLAANGWTSAETAEFLQVKPSTIETYRKNIKRKLACSSMAQAVFEGMRYGYLKPGHIGKVI